MNANTIQTSRCERPGGTRTARWFLLLLGALLLHVSTDIVYAYPPAPFHLFYGMLRDEYGTPISTTGAEVILETASGVTIKTAINPGIETAANYRLEVPMDAGLLAKPYQPTALRPFVPFRIKVRIAGTIYLPIEMTGDYANLGQPGQRTRLNLTLGEDSNGDGLPDAWQRLINADLSKVKPGGDAGNGLTYLQTYYAGTYAVDPKNGFALNIVGFSQGAPLLEFLAVTGRTYTLLGSRDLKTWTPMPFRVPAEGTNAVAHAIFQTDAVKTVQLEAVSPATELPPTYFRLMLQ
ncbi:MAG: hypothetical protein EBS05_11270 [Proteobacteria bacterium]|nr:hypothetical protein [Pseudomonadota bacterium]